MKKGFTIAEVLLALVIVGILISVSIPVITRTANQDFNKLYRAAYKIAEKAIDEAVFNPALFTSGNLQAPASGNFCNNFAGLINTAGTVNCTASNITNQEPNFITTNGMLWYGLDGSFSNTTCPAWVTGNCMDIRVDINGKKLPNAVGQDILRISVSNIGKVYANDMTERSYLNFCTGSNCTVMLPPDPVTFIQNCNNATASACTAAFNNNWNRSCRQIKDVWTDATDGAYSLTYDNSGTSYKAYCDMTTAGGGWTLVMKQKQGDRVTLKGDVSYWTNPAAGTLNDNATNLNETDENLVSKAFTIMQGVNNFMLKASNEATAKFHNVTANNAFAAFNMPPAYYKDDAYDLACPTNCQSTGCMLNPDWFIRETHYESGTSGELITSARFGFNYWNCYTINSDCAARVRWGWTANEGGCDHYTGSHDRVGGLGGYGGTYEDHRTSWQPGTLYLYVK